MIPHQYSAPLDATWPTCTYEPALKEKTGRGEKTLSLHPAIQKTVNDRLAYLRTQIKTVADRIESLHNMSQTERIVLDNAQRELRNLESALSKELSH